MAERGTLLRCCTFTGTEGSNPSLSAKLKIGLKPVFSSNKRKRRGARVVEWNGLENRRGCKLTEGSNPSLSATKIMALVMVFVLREYKNLGSDRDFSFPAIS